MKRFWSIIAAAMFAVAAQACWFGDNDLSGLGDNYLAYLSGDVTHVEIKDGTTTITNNQVVALPFTVFVKVAPHKRAAEGEEAAESPAPITKAILQYKLTDDKEWTTVKTIENPDWDMSFEDPVALFGRDCIDIPNVSTETEVIIRLHLSDGVYTTGSLENDDFTDIQETITVNGTTEDDHFNYSGGWTAPFVWKVKVKPNVGNNGTKPSRRPHR